MLKKRLIPCLVLKDNLIVQSIGFKKYLPIGVAKIAVEFVAKWDVDEIFLIDITATKEKRKPNLKKHRYFQNWSTYLFNGKN